MPRCLEVIGVVFGVALILLAAPISYAQTGNSTGNISVTAAVAARTFIMLDQNGEIEQVVNNSTTLAEIVVVQGSPPQLLAVANPSVINQLEQLKTKHNFERYGQVYQRQAGFGAWLKDKAQNPGVIKALIIVAATGL